MHHGVLSGTNPTTYWKTISEKSILDLTSNGRLTEKRLAEYISKGKVSVDKVLKNIDFSDPLEGAKVLKKYYSVLF